MKSTDLLYAINYIDESFIDAALSYRQNKKRRRKESERTPVVYLKRVAVIILAVISVSFGILLTNDRVRASITDAVVTWYDKYLKIEFSKIDDTETTDTETTDTETTDTEDSESVTEKAPEVENLAELEIGYVPDGYELQSADEDHFYREYIYMTEEEDNYLLIAFYLSEGSSFMSDTEHMICEETTINGYDAYKFFSDEEDTKIITYGNSKFYVVISTSTIPMDELIKIAETIK